MKVKELIECLKKFDQEKEIVFDCSDTYCNIIEEFIHDEDKNWIIISYE
jgi:hypothetical protein